MTLAHPPVFSVGVAFCAAPMYNKIAGMTARAVPTKGNGGVSYGKPGNCETMDRRKQEHRILRRRRCQHRISSAVLRKYTP